jgi:hypothetical protein
MRISRLFATAVLLVLPGNVCFATEQDPCDGGASVSDVQFTLNLRGGQTQFREGEIIPLVLSFSTASSRYWLNTASYDRSGRLGIDTYCVEPEGIDPLGDYFRMGFIGGGLFSNLHLIEKPFTHEAELNEWHRLRPGHYRLYVVSHRVSRSPEAGEASETGNIGLSIASNSVEFEVTAAEEAWEKEQVHDAVATLTNSAKPEEIKHAARVLRFLGTRDATQAMAKVFSGDMQDRSQFDLMFGLYGSPFPDLAVKAMRAEYAVPAHAIGGGFLDLLVRLQTDPDPAWALPAGGPPPTDFWKRFEAHRKELMRAEVADLASAVSSKTGSARAITLNTLLGAASDDPSLVQMLRPALIASWKDLPARTQEEMILYRWQAIDSPAMLPILRAIIALPPAHSMQPDDLRNAALKHIYEFDPAEGKALIARNLASSSVNLTLENIRVLSAEQIQATIPGAVERIRNYSGRKTDYELLDRYGDRSVLASVQAILEDKDRNACGYEPQVLRYVLRVAPDYGVEQVRRAMAERNQTRCFTQLLQALGDQIPQAEQIAIEALDDPEQDVQQDAVIALTRWGTSEAEEPMWKRLERFHEEWAGRAADLRRTPDFQSEGSRAVGFEQALAQGIAWGQGWISPPEKLARLAKLVLTDYDSKQIDHWSEEWKGSTHLIESGWFPAETPTFSLMGYSGLTEDQLRTKLEQFPRGSHFDWLIWMPGQIQPAIAVSRQEEVFERVRADADAHGIVIENQTQP